MDYLRSVYQVEPHPIDTELLAWRNQDALKIWITNWEGMKNMLTYTIDIHNWEARRPRNEQRSGREDGWMEDREIEGNSDKAETVFYSTQW